MTGICFTAISVQTEGEIVLLYLHRLCYIFQFYKDFIRIFIGYNIHSQIFMKHFLLLQELSEVTRMITWLKPDSYVIIIFMTKVKQITE